MSDITLLNLPGAIELAGDDQLAVGQQRAVNAVVQAAPDTRKFSLGQIMVRDFAARSSPFLARTPSGVRTLTLKKQTFIPLIVPDGNSNNIDHYYYADSDQTLNVASLLDTGSISPGTDYKVFLCWTGTAFTFSVSLASKAAPSGYSTANSRVIGGFHTLCADAGTGMTYWHFDSSEALPHPLNGYVAGDILPQSVWCLNDLPYAYHRAMDTGVGQVGGMVYVPPVDRWVDIYLQSGSGEQTKSSFGATHTVSRQYADHLEDMFCVGKDLLSETDFAAAALGSNEQTVIAGAADAGTVGGHSDTTGRRMISAWGVEECCGYLAQWLDGIGQGGSQQYPEWNTQSGEKGSWYGDCFVLLAGGAWGAGTPCGSRYRYASDVRSATSADFGGRGRSRALHF
jgi:hypothetical protein